MCPDSPTICTDGRCSTRRPSAERVRVGTRTGRHPELRRPGGSMTSARARTARRSAARVASTAASIVLVLWGAATLAFLALRITPGDPVEVMLGPQAQVGEAVKEGIR